MLSLNLGFGGGVFPWWGRGGAHLMKQARAAPAATRAETRRKMRRTKLASIPEEGEEKRGEEGDGEGSQISPPPPPQLRPSGGHLMSQNGEEEGLGK